MLPKTEVKYIQSLSQKKLRAQYGQFIVEGPKLLAELMTRKPQWVTHIYGTQDWWVGQQKQIQNKMQKHFTEIADFELDKISQLQTPQQVVAVATIPKEELHRITNLGFTLVLDGIQDPGNMGTIIRTAHWFGINTIICSPDCADVYQSKVVQASMGSIFAVPIVYEPLEVFFNQNKLPVFGALLHGKPLPQYEAEGTPNGCIVIGNEGKGIRPEWMSFITHPVMIPGHSDAESLNAAIATGILLYSFTKK